MQLKNQQKGTNMKRAQSKKQWKELTNGPYVGDKTVPAIEMLEKNSWALPLGVTATQRNRKVELVHLQRLRRQLERHFAVARRQA